MYENYNICYQFNYYWYYCNQLDKPLQNEYFCEK